MNAFHFGSSSMKMEKSHRKQRCLFMNYLSYTALIAFGWQTFNCISSFGVMSMDILKGSNELQTMITTAVHPSLTPLGIQATHQQESISSISSDHIMDSSKLDTIASNAFDTTPIEGWQCYCWNSTYEVINFEFSFLPHIIIIIWLKFTAIGIFMVLLAPPKMKKKKKKLLPSVPGAEKLRIVICPYLITFHLIFNFTWWHSLTLNRAVWFNAKYYYTFCVLIYLCVHRKITLMTDSHI